VRWAKQLNFLLEAAPRWGRLPKLVERTTTFNFKLGNPFDPVHLVTPMLGLLQTIFAINKFIALVLRISLSFLTIV